MRLDLVSGVFWLLLSVAGALESYRLHLGSWQKPGSGFLPFVAACFLGVFSLILSLKTLAAWRKTKQEEGVFPSKGWNKAAFVLLLLLGYGLGLERLGFMITTFLFLVLLLKTIEPQTWRKTILFSLLVSILSYVFFQVWLKTQLPSGFLASLGF
jgi:putative tricarboxylic transport membrane protein